MADNFFGEYVAPALFLGGAAVTGARAYDEVRRTGGVMSPWKRHKAARQLLNDITMGRQRQRLSETGRTHVADLFNQLQQLGPDAEKFVTDDIMRVSKHMAGANVAGASLGDVIRRDTQVAEIAQRVMSGYGIRQVSKDPRVWQAQSQSVMRVADEVASAMPIGNMAEFFGTRPILAGELDAGRSVTSRLLSGRDAVEQVFGQHMNLSGRSDLRSAMLEVQSAMGRDMDLHLLSRGGDPFAFRVQQRSGKFRPMDIGIVQESEGVRFIREGNWGQEQSLVRMLPNEDINRVIRARDLGVAPGPRGLGGISEFDVSMARRARNILGRKDSFESYYEFMNELRGGPKADTGHAIIQRTGNLALDRKISHQITLSRLPSEIGESYAEIAMARLNMDLREGLSASQEASGILQAPSITGRTYGSGPFGYSVGDNKAMSQALRPAIKYSGATPAARVMGIAQSVSGEAAMIANTRATIMPGNVLGAMFDRTGLAGMGIHEDEIFIFGDTGRTSVQKTFRIQEQHSRMYQATADMVAGGMDPIAGGTVLADLPGGGQMRIPEGFTFSPSAVERAEDVGQLIIRGSLEKPIEVGDKQFSHLRAIVKGRLGDTEGRMMAASYEYARSQGISDPAAIADIYESSMRRGGTRAFEQEAWQSALARTEDVTQIGTKSMKKMGERTMGVVTQGIYSEIAEEHAKAIGRRGAIGDRFRRVKSGLESRIAQRNMKIQALQDNAVWGETVTQQMVDDAGAAMIQAEQAARDRLLGGRDLSTMDRKARRAFGKSMMSDSAYMAARDEFLGLSESFALNESLNERIAMGDQAVRDLEIGELRRANARNQARIGSIGRAAESQLLRENFLVSEMEQSMGRLGMVAAGDGRYFVQDLQIAEAAERAAAIRGIGGSSAAVAMAENLPQQDLVQRFQAGLLETMYESGGSVRKWSAHATISNLHAAGAFGADTELGRLAAGVANADISDFGSIRDMTERIFKSDEGWDAVVRELSSAKSGLTGADLAFGTVNLETSMDIAPMISTGSGGRGSYGMPMHQHLLQQGGVYAEAGREIIGRTLAGPEQEAASLYRRLAALKSGYGGEGVLASDIQSKLTMREMDRLFSGNQAVRDRAFADAAERLGIDAGEGMVIRGAEGGRMFLPRQLDNTTGVYVTAAGEEVSRPMDRAIRSAIAGEADALGNYEKALAEAMTGKGAAPTSMTKGKVRGSMRAQARSAFRETGGSMMRGGVFEEDFIRMARDLGLDDAGVEARLADLRAGREVAMVSRDPATELYRINAQRLYSVDESIRREMKLNPQKALTQFYARQEGVTLEMAKKRAQSESARIMASANKEAEIGKAASRAIKQSRQLARGGKTATPYFAPDWTLQLMGMDFDNDHVSASLLEDTGLRDRVMKRAAERDLLIEQWKAKGAASGVTPEQFVQKIGGTTASQTDFLYYAHQDALYRSLKGRPGSVLTSGDLQRGTDAWVARARGAAKAAALEKRSIGSMTNVVDLTRNVLRSRSASETARNMIFSEMLLGVLPEASLKARQAGAKGVGAVAEGVDALGDILAGRVEGSADELGGQFRKAFQTVFPEMDQRFMGEMLDTAVPGIIDAVEASAGNQESLLQRLLKRESSDASTLDDIYRKISDEANRSVQSEAFRQATTEGEAALSGTVRRHMKNAETTAEQVWKAVVKNKRPLVLGAVGALGVGMLLGRPGHISEDEAIAAGARHESGEPSMGQADRQEVAPVAEGSGRSIRIRGRMSGDPDAGGIARTISDIAPNASIDMNVSDFRERINEDRVMRRINGRRYNG